MRRAVLQDYPTRQGFLRACGGQLEKFEGLSPAFGQPWRTLALPLAAMHALALGLHQGALRRSARAAPKQPSSRDLPLLVLGALRLSGSGKTSLTAKLAEAFLAQGRRVALLAYHRPDRPWPWPAQEEARRGCSGAVCHEVRVDSDWRQCSDEALLLKRLVPRAQVYTTRHRAKACEYLAKADAPPDCILSDDGLMDPRLHPKARVVIMRPGESPDWRQLFPAGPYRATSRMLRATDGVLRGPGDARLDSMAECENPESSDSDFGRDFIRHLGWHFSRHLSLPPMDLFPGSGKTASVLALSGHGNPGAFFAWLQSQGLRRAGSLIVPNHHAFPLAALSDLARKHPEGLFLCSPKDAVKLLPAEKLGDMRRGFMADLDLGPGFSFPLGVCGHDLILSPALVDWAAERLFPSEENRRDSG